MWLRTLAFIATAATVTPARSASDHDANCGYKGVTVEVTEPADLALACDALADVRAYQTARSQLSFSGIAA